MKKLVTGKPLERAFLLGNEAIARGALEAGVRMFSCYPGTPSSEVMDSLLAARRCFQDGETCPVPISVEYSINEKVALEVAAGAALAGVKSLVTMKHVGLNVAADPLFTAAYIGLPGGLVILSADDPGCHSSQNEQDNRQYARFANLPCLEPASSQEALDMTREAFEIARFLEQPVLLRTTTRVSHMRGGVTLGNLEISGPVPFSKEPGRFVPVPQVALKRHKKLEEQMTAAKSISENSVFNKWKKPPVNTGYGIIASGVSRNYVADALKAEGLEKSMAVLELGMTWPLPENLLREFMESYKKILIVEEGEPLLENDIRALAQELGIDVNIFGKNDILTPFAEYSSSIVGAAIDKWLSLPDSGRMEPVARKLPSRPPNLCPGCAHRSIYYAVRRLFGDNAIYSSDIGCYTLGLADPLKTADFLVCMGSSISAGSGFAKASKKPVIAFIGDSTFFHSGMTGLANAVFNKHDILVVILDNGTTAMTGHQPNPGMHQDVLTDAATHLDIESIVKALGIENVVTVKAHNLGAVSRALEEFGKLSGVRVIIAREPCMLYAHHNLKRKKVRVAEVTRQGDEAEECLRNLACPAFFRENGNIRIDENLCSGCMTCVQIAPQSFGTRKYERNR